MTRKRRGREEGSIYQRGDGLWTASVSLGPATEGGWLRKPNFQRLVYRPLQKAAGLPAIRFHDLRHRAATLMLLNDVNVKVVSERLGHASIQLTLDTYSHVLPSMQRIAADKMDAFFRRTAICG